MIFDFHFCFIFIQVVPRYNVIGIECCLLTEFAMEIPTEYLELYRVVRPENDH